MQSQDNRCIASCGTTVIATCAHLASKGSPTHRKLWCDRHRNLRAPCKRSVANASQVVMRLSSQLARTLHTQGRQRIARCGATVIATSGAHVNRRITHAVQAAVRLAPNTYAHIAIVAIGTSHVTLRAQSQHGCSSQVQNVLRSANCGTPVITPRARLAIPTSLTRRKLRCDRPQPAWLDVCGW